MSKITNSATELRALPIFDTLPMGCIVFPVSDQMSEPHLKLGEFAVCDAIAGRCRDPGAVLSLFMADGPSLIDHFRSRIVGRIIGVLSQNSGDDRFLSLPAPRGGADA